MNATNLLFAVLMSLTITSTALGTSRTLKVAMLQISPTVGDYNGTLAKVLSGYKKAISMGADIMVTPEGIFPGYPAWDMLDRDDFVEGADRALALLQEATKNQETAILVGHITFNPDDRGRRLLNVASVLEDGQITFQQVKALLPTYDVFDDARYFEPGKRTKIFEFRGFKLGIQICESWWYGDKHAGRSIYRKDPIDRFRQQGIDLGISLSVSPYYRGKGPIREAVHSEVAKSLSSPIIYVNSVGGIDEVQMDGASFVVDSKGTVSGRLANFQEDLEVVEIHQDKTIPPRFSQDANRTRALPSDNELVLKALIQGLRDYMAKTGQKQVVFGLSGGLDSAVTAAVATLALGPENVKVILMPSEFSSEGSITDAKASAANLGIPDHNVIVVPIKDIYNSHLAVLSKALEGTSVKFEGESFVPFENLQPRIRMAIELFVANSLPNAIKLQTSNKSEIAMGYSTMYGDSSGGLVVLGDLYKTEVKALAQYLNNREGKEMVPWTTINKKFSAELRNGQITELELPPYDFLDPLLRDLLENGISAQELRNKYSHQLAKTHGVDWVDKVLKTFQRAEWKRKQAPPIIKVSPKTFGIGRRVPVTGLKFQDLNYQRLRCTAIFE